MGTWLFRSTGGPPIGIERLTAAALVGMALLLFLIIRSKLHAFVALLLASLIIGAGAGMPLDDVIHSVTTGMGGTLGTIAVLVGLGAMFGQMLETSGGAETMADALLGKFGEERAGWSLGVAGFVIAIPVFFDVGFIILVPTIYGLARRTQRSLVFYGLPLLAGLAVTHAFIPPTPGPIAVAGLLGANLGLVILFGAIAGLPAMIIAGPLFAGFIHKRIQTTVPGSSDISETVSRREGRRPSLGLVVGLTAFPLAMILIGTLATATLAEGNAVRDILVFAGHPFVALLLTTLGAFHFLGRRLGMDNRQVRAVATRALEPAGVIILVTGAGGVLKQVLIDSGVGRVLAEGLGASALSPILTGFSIAAILRLMQGSATVAMLSAAGLMAALVQNASMSDASLALMVIAIAAGATTTSHVNDSGFWLVSRYLGLSVTDTLRTWTAATTLIAVTGLVIALALGAVLS